MNGHLSHLVVFVLVFLGLLDSPISALGQQPCLRWFQVTSAGSPGPRYGHAMAYDSDRGVTVLFGGALSPLLPVPPTDNETWEYDGEGWRVVPIIGSKPSARLHHAMAYDAARKQVVLFGGAAPSNRETWVYTSDGVTGTWTQLFPNHAPPGITRTGCDEGLYGHSMVNDTVRQVVLLHGGAMRCESVREFEPDYDYVLDETWQWNGLDWVRIPVGNAGDRWGAAMVFDSSRGTTVLFGGDGCAEANCYSDNHTLRIGTWEYAGGTWTQVAASSPALRTFHTMAYDNRRNKVVMFGGNGVGLGDDTDEYTAGVGWTSLLDSGPPPRSFHAMVYDRRREVTVIYGGLRPSDFGPYDDTWELDVCTRPPENVRWVDFAYGGQEAGTFPAPFNTLAEGIASVSSGGTLKIKAGASAESPTISKPMTISAYGGPVRIGQ